MSFKSGTFLFSLSGILAGSGVSDVLESESEVNERLEDEQSIQIIFFQCNFKRNKVNRNFQQFSVYSILFTEQKITQLT